MNSVDADGIRQKVFIDIAGEHIGELKSGSLLVRKTEEEEIYPEFFKLSNIEMDSKKLETSSYMKKAIEFKTRIFSEIKTNTSEKYKSEPVMNELITDTATIGTYSRTMDVDVDGNYVYTINGNPNSFNGADQNYFIVYDRTSPNDLHEVGRVSLMKMPWTMHVSNGYAYLAAGEYGGLIVVDISIPTQPTIVYSSTSLGRFSELFVRGDRLYANNESNEEFHIVDISNPNEPALISTIPNPGTPRGVEVVGNYAYIISDGLKVIDISNENAPVQVAQLSFTASQRLDVIESKLYAATSTGFVIVDISNPLNPNIIGTQTVAGGASYDIRVITNFAYVTTDNVGLHVYDVTNPNQIVEVDFVPFSVVVRSDIEDNFIYTAHLGGGLYSSHINSLHQVTYTDHVHTGSLVMGARIVGNLAYLFEETGKLIIYNLSNINEPTFVSSVSVGYIDGYLVNGNYVYIVSRGLQGLNSVQRFKVVNVSNSSSPYVESTLTFLLSWDEQLWGNTAIAVNGNYAYLRAISNNSVAKIIDISSPSNPVSVTGNISEAGAQMEVINNKLYTNAGGFKILDLLDPLNPAVLGTYSFGSRFAIDGTRSFISNGYSFQAVDISNPAQPSLMGSFGQIEGGTIKDIDANQGYAFTMHENNLINVFKVSNPSSPTIVEMKRYDGYGNTIQREGNRLYISSRSVGLKIMKANYGYIGPLVVEPGVPNPTPTEVK